MAHRLTGDRRSTGRMAELDRLLSLVPPPASPVDADVDWTRVEAELGLSLPGDFKEIVRRYGAGRFCDDLSTCAPDLLLEYNQGLPASWGPIRAENPGEFEFPLFPEPGGLVIWGLDSIGGALCWPTEGAPEQWEVVLWKQRDGEFERWDCGAAEFLAAADRAPCRGGRGRGAGVRSPVVHACARTRVRLRPAVRGATAVRAAASHPAGETGPHGRSGQLGGA